VEDVRHVPPDLVAGTFIGFGFVGLVLGSFVGWCTGLLSRVAGQMLLEYIMIGAGIGIMIGVISGYFIRTQSKSA
jgi:hypothetical protein